MATTYLLSYPGPDWHIRGAENFRSRGRDATNPRAALAEWIALADAITRAGGHILVMAPVPGEALTGLTYTANAGMLFHQPSAIGSDGWIWLQSRMSVPHRQAERAPIERFVAEAGLEVREAKHAWEGQADVQFLGGNRFVLTWGVRTSRESIDEVRAVLPPSAQVLEVELREPFFHGDTCLDPLVNRAGDMVLLVHGGALVGDGLDWLRRFVGLRIDLLAIDHDDALAYGCNVLGVNGTVLAPTGLSVGLRGQLLRRGFAVDELDMPELFGKGGGGPRCLVNELRGLVLSPQAPSYEMVRDSIVARLDRYPETYAPPAPPSPADVTAKPALD